MQGSSPVATLQATVAFERSSFTSDGSSLSCEPPSSIFVCTSHWGPFHHNWLPMSSWMKLTLFRTNACHLSAGARIHANATFESSRAYTNAFLKDVDSIIFCAKSASRTAPFNSARAIEMAFKGATHATWLLFGLCTLSHRYERLSDILLLRMRVGWRRRSRAAPAFGCYLTPQTNVEFARP